MLNVRNHTGCFRVPLRFKGPPLVFESLSSMRSTTQTQSLLRCGRGHAPATCISCDRIPPPQPFPRPRLEAMEWRMCGVRCREARRHSISATAVPPTRSSRGKAGTKPFPCSPGIHRSSSQPCAADRPLSGDRSNDAKSLSRAFGHGNADYVCPVEHGGKAPFLLKTDRSSSAHSLRCGCGGEALQMAEYETIPEVPVTRGVHVRAASSPLAVGFTLF